ncbi:MAG: secondary thiamine-phosphate synthase enzyme YjbQ [Clostridia bacterium]|nr:secondary thiamine-phosphate synthase enzyme YjbQ [Clostridia bacterium]
MEILTVRTDKRDQFVNITAQVQEVVRQQGISSGICVVFVPHTTAGVTINENADSDVVRDIIYELDKGIPWQDGYRHGEGNSAAHIKASLMGSAVTVIIEEGRLQLGTWQGIYFAEFDGPRQRKAYVKVLK